MWRRRAIDASAVPSKIGLHILSDYKCYFVDRLRNAVLKREAGRPLLTVSNHRCVVDDPALISVFFDFDELHRVELQRWGLCAREVCFKRPFFVPYFNAVKVFPIDRAGAGVRQQSMKNLQHRFDNAEWIHIFPEGRVVQTDDMGPLKWGSFHMSTYHSE
jgi:monolysocardiolipin acyltransferase